MKKKFVLLLMLLGFINLSAQAIVEPKNKQNVPLEKQYKNVTKDRNVMDALEMLNGTVGEFSKNAILGENLTEKPIKVEFRNLAEIGPQYANFDALAWKQSKRLYIYINQKHLDAPKEALAALLAHEAVHQDELNSLNEETYAWTLEAAVWTTFLEDNPEIAKLSHPLVERQKTIHKLFVKGNYTNEFIRKSVVSNLDYSTLPSRSPGFEDVDTL